MSVINLYEALKNRIASLEGDREKVNQLADKEKHRIEWDVYYPQIQALKEAERKEIDKLKQDTELRVAEIEGQVAQSREELRRINRMLTLMDISKDAEVMEPVCYYYTDRDDQGNYLHDKRKLSYKPIDVLCKDKYKHINVYIVKNGKPKNQYSLFVVGYSLFMRQDDRLLSADHRYSYVSGVSEEHDNIRLRAKDAPTEKELHAWYEKHKAELLKDLLVEHVAIEKEYEHALTLVGSKEWQILYLLDKKDYYENQYSRGTEQPEYKQVLRELKKMGVDI